MNNAHILHPDLRPLARIRLDALHHNLRVVRKAAPAKHVMAVVKADGYGHGMLRVANQLRGDADAMAVSRVHEGVTLREAGMLCPIVLLEGFGTAEEYAACRQYGLNPVLHQLSQIEILEHAGNAPTDCWVKLDTGMHRLGFNEVELVRAVSRLQRLPGVDRVGFMTHFACADDPTDPTTAQQIRRFFEQIPEGHPTSLANSAAILGMDPTPGDWVRPGIMLYGSSPLLRRSAIEFDLQPVMTLQASLLAIRALRRGDAIGYGSTWVCPEDMHVGVIGIGYGDGYPRLVPSGTPVLLDGREAAILGRVSMDMITIDLRQHPQAQVGDRATLWGDGLPVERIAAAAGTISYELLCGITSRVRIEEIHEPHPHRY